LNRPAARASALLPIALWSLAACGMDAQTPPVAGDAAAADYEVDPHWPRTLPNSWALGQVSGIAVDRSDHIWIVHRPGTITDRVAGAEQDPPWADCCFRAPPVIQFDSDGNVLRAWGGPGEGYEWPGSEHGIFVDRQDNVWIGGGGENQVLKFTADGEFLLQIGRRGVSEGSNDTTSLGGPASIFVDDERGEVYIADGYGNRRVIVFDATTGEYRRHWGSYGNRPDDAYEFPRYSADALEVDQFRGPVHGIVLARDGRLYVGDRSNNRIQVFERDGTFLAETFVSPHVRGEPRPPPQYEQGSVWDVLLSVDPEQRYLYVADGSSYKIWVLRRDDLEVIGEFGSYGRNAGQFGWVHALAMDSHGTLYTSEVDTYKRAQKFVPRNQ